MIGVQPLPDSKRSWLLLSVLVLGYVGVYLCRKNLSVAVPLIRAEFGINKEQVGRIASTGTLAYAIGKMALGPVIDRLGGRICFLTSLLIVAICGAAGAFVPSLGALALIYSFNRFAGAASWGSMVKQTPPWFGPKNLALAMAILSLSYVFGGVAAVTLAGQISATSGQSWRMVMGVPSVVLLMLLAACVFLLPADTKRSSARAAVDDSGFRWGLFRELLRMRSFWVVCALSFTLTLLRETFNDWTVDFIKTQGGADLSMRVAAFFSTSFDLCGAAGIIVLGSVFGRMSAIARSCLLAGILTALTLLLALLPSLVPLGLGIVVPAIGLIGFLALGPYSLLAGYFSVQLKGPACAATVAGIVDSTGYVAGILAGSAFGWLLDHGGYTLGFQVLAGCSLVSAFLALALNVQPAQESGLATT